MSKNRNRLGTWAVRILLAVGRAGRGDPGAPDLRERHGKAPSPDAAERAIGHALGPIAAMVRGSGSRAANHAGRPRRTEPARAFGGGWRRRRHRLGRGLRLGRPRDARARHADTRFKIGTASTVLTSAAVGVLLEKDRLKLEDEIQTYVPQFPKKPGPVTLRQLMGARRGRRRASAGTREHCFRNAASGPSKR